MILLSKKDMQTKVEVVKYDDKASTYTVKFLDGDDKNEVKTYSSTTIKRWWKKIEEPKENPKKEYEEKKKTRRSSMNRSEIVDKIQKTFDIKLSEYPSTPGLYSFGNKPKRTIGITRSGITIYRKKQDSIKISYASDYMSELKEKLF